MSTYRPWFDDPPRRSDVVTIPLFWIAFVLSLLLHVAAIWYIVERQPLLLPGMERNDVSVPLSVTLATAPASHPRATPPASTPPPPAPARPARAATSRPRRPIVLSAIPGVPSPERIPMASPPIVPTPVSPPAQDMAGDLSSYIAAQRLARGEARPTPSANPADDAEARRDRAIAANLASSSSPTYYGEPKNSGGVFQVTYIGYDDAEFTFFGWNRDIRRRASQKIDVRRGDAPNIRLAIVRKMISIIRQFEQEDFSWKSDRLGHTVTLSARKQDQPALEDFLMRDFFDTLQNGH
ncbi:MAG: hypothetical protein ABI190_03305 [Casimicrobiaceae bacterium]